MKRRLKPLEFLHNWKFGLSLSVASILISACALFGTGNLSVPKAHGYAVHPPGRWREVNEAESDRAYRLASGNVVTLNSSCDHQSHDPLEILLRDLTLGTRNVVYRQKYRMMVDGEEGLYAAVTSTLNNTPFYMRLFVLPKEGCVFDFSLLSPKPISPTETDEFISFVKSFKYGKDNHHTRKP